MSDLRTSIADERLRQEFNQWAEEGKGEEMEQHHISITEQTLAMMNLKPGERCSTWVAEQAGLAVCWRRR